MRFEKKELPLILIILAMFLSSFFLYSQMPERMPTHWNSEGEVDGYGNRFMGLFFMPILLSAIYLLFLFLPKMMVYRKNFEGFRGYFFGFKVVFILFFVVIYISTLLPNLGIDVNMNYVMIPALAVLFFYMGHMLKYVKRNYFIGIRTPWTMASEDVWDKTHILASKMFKLFALIIFSALFVPDMFVWFLLAPLGFIVLYLLTYSYQEYKKEVKR